MLLAWIPHAPQRKMSEEDTSVRKMQKHPDRVVGSQTFIISWGATGSHSRYSARTVSSPWNKWSLLLSWGFPIFPSVFMFIYSWCCSLKFTQPLPVAAHRWGWVVDTSSLEFSANFLKCVYLRESVHSTHESLTQNKSFLYPFSLPLPFFHLSDQSCYLEFLCSYGGCYQVILRFGCKKHLRQTKLIFQLLLSTVTELDFLSGTFVYWIMQLGISV